MSASLLLIRHGCTEWNVQGRYQGHGGPPLNATGRAQARRLARALRGLRLGAVYSSDLERAVMTAAPLARARGLPVTTDPALRELDFGAWEGRRAGEVIAADPLGWARWWQNPLTLAPPGGETVLALWDRVSAVLGQIAARHPGETVAVVTHGGPLQLILTRLACGRLHPPAAGRVPTGGWLLLTSVPQITQIFGLHP